MPPHVNISPGGPDVRERVARLLRSVPEWFGIESATQKYIEESERLPTFVASVDDEDVAFVTLAMHFPRAAEVYCMAVRKDWHGRGVGTALMRFVESRLRGRGIEYLQVKTQGPSRPSPEYALTLRFYEACGFVPLEELQGLWPGIPALLLVKRL